MTMHSWFPVEINFSVLEIVFEFSFSAPPCMLHIRSMSSWTLSLVFLPRKLERSFSPSYLRVKAIVCILVYDVILLSRMYSATFLNVRRLALTFQRDTSVPFDKSEHLHSPEFRVALFFCLVGFHTSFGSGGTTIS